MELKCTPCEKPKYGVLVLGNVGAVKSYICNLIIGDQIFNTNCRREAVTTYIECHRIDTGSSDLLIYNIPGLIATDQDAIDRNKKEIIKAFELCPISVVIFVWTNVDGRPQPDDVIAFKILQEAYRFSSKSLIFVVNNVPCKRPSTYEEKFIVLLKKVLDPMPVSLEDIFFLDTLKSEDTDKFAATSDRLLFLIAQHKEIEQKMQADIIVRFSELRARREVIKLQYIKIEESKKSLEYDIKQMALEYEAVKNDQEKKYRDIMFRIEAGIQQQEQDEDTDDEEDSAGSDTSQEGKKTGSKGQSKQLWKKIECEKGIFKKVEKSYQIARTELVVIHKGDKCDEAKNCKPSCGIIKNNEEKCDKTDGGSFKKIQKKFNKICHVKCQCDSLRPTLIGGAVGAGVGGVTGAAVGGVAGAVFGPCAVATAAAGAVAGAAVGGVVGAVAGTAIGAGTDGGIGGAIFGLYRGRKRHPCRKNVREPLLETRFYT